MKTHSNWHLYATVSILVLKISPLQITNGKKSRTPQLLSRIAFPLKGFPFLSLNYKRVGTHHFIKSKINQIKQKRTRVWGEACLFSDELCTGKYDGQDSLKTYDMTKLSFHSMLNPKKEKKNPSNLAGSNIVGVMCFMG